MSDRGPGVEPSWGLGVAAGFNRYIAATASYAWNRLASLNEETCLYGTCFRVRGQALIYEFTTGLRINAANPSRATPYLLVMAGLTQARASGEVMGFTVSYAEWKPAFGAGVGVDIGVGGPFALVLDLRLLRPSEMRWYARAGVGIGLRFK